MLGSAFGVLGVWPAMLAAVHWREHRRALVIAIAGLSNYVGGAAGVLFFPTFANTADELLNVFRIQAFASAVLGALMLSWCWLPAFHEGVSAMKALEATVDASPLQSIPDLTTAPSTHALTIKQELRLIFKGRAPFQVVCFGIFVGSSLALQGISPFIFSSVGFSSINSGLSNACYQLSAAVVGVGLGSRVQNQKHLRHALRTLHIVMLVSIAAIFGLCLLVRAYGVFAGAPAIVVVFMIFLGGSLMGALPFCIQQLLYTAHPVSENVASGCLYMIAAPLAAILTQLSTVLDPVIALLLIMILLVLELAIYAICSPSTAKAG